MTIDSANLVIIYYIVIILTSQKQHHIWYDFAVCVRRGLWLLLLALFHILDTLNKFNYISNYKNVLAGFFSLEWAGSVFMKRRTPLKTCLYKGKFEDLVNI